MIGSLRAELRKIWSVRSTYIILLFSLVLMGIFAFWVEGIKAGSGDGAPVTYPYKLASLMRDAITNLAFFGSLVGVLSATHEYRYNLITYTLTSSRSRSKVLFAKVLAVSIYALLFAVFVALFSAAFMYVGLGIKGLTLVHQIIPGDLWWRILFEAWGSAMLGLLIATIVRQQVGAIATFFIIPVAVEPLIALLLKTNQVYLPFIALQQVTHLEGSGMSHLLSHSKAALVTVIYIGVGWIVAWYLFLKRDAN
jgi:ABC-2 type transport system permease protein